MTRALPNDAGHEAASEELAELALGVLAGERRTELLQHCEQCVACRRELAELAQGLDALLCVAPAVEPPAGFEARVLAAIAPRRRRRPRLTARARRVLVAAALVLGAGLTGAGLTRALAPPAAARTAALVVHGHGRGEVVVTGERSPLLVVRLQGGNWPAWVSCELVTAAGQRIALGPYAVGPRGGIWSARLAVPATTLDSVRLISADGSVLAWAPLRA